MKAFLSILMLLLSSAAFAMTEPMNDGDYELLRQFLSGEGNDITLEQNNRIFPMVKLDASKQPQELIDLGDTAKKLTEKMAKAGIDNDSILKAAAILKMKEASELRFNSHPLSDAEKIALANIEALHTSLKK